MHKNLFIIGFVFLVMSCQYGLNPYGYYEHTKELDASWQRTASYLYIDEPENIDYWKSPTEFHYDGGGDCEDFCVHLLYQLGSEASIVVVQEPNVSYYHTLVKYNGQYLEAQIYNLFIPIDSVEVIREYSYDEVMHYATNGGKK